MAPPKALYPATCLVEEGGRVPDLASLLTRLLWYLGVWYEIFARDGFTPVREAWLERAYRSAYTIKAAGETFWGVFKDLDPDGNLIVRLANGAERVISSGDILSVHESPDASSH